MGLDDLELSPASDGHGMDQMGFDTVARVKASYETGAEFDEGRGGILIQGAVGGGEAVAAAVAGGIALALSGDGSSRTGAIGAGSLDLF